jgi:hypothetical protein
MISLPSPVEGITIERDLRSGAWHLRAGAASATLREWTWGERRRLLESATAEGTLDGALFIAGLLDLVLDAVLPDVDASTLAFTCLYLLGVPENARPAPLARAEFLAATTFGWAPQQMARQPASDIDRLLASIAPPTEVDDGWTHIILLPEAVSSITTRLEGMLRTLAAWAGLAAVAAPEEQPRAPDSRREADAPAGAHTPTGGGNAPPIPEGAAREPASEPAADQTAGPRERLRPRQDTGPKTDGPPEGRPRGVAGFAERSSAGRGRRPPEPVDGQNSHRPFQPTIRGTARLGRVTARPVRTATRPNSPRPMMPESATAPPRGREPAGTAAPTASARTTMPGTPEAARRLPPRQPREAVPQTQRAPAPPALDDPDFFPPVRAALQWPEAAGVPANRGEPTDPARLPENPFELSDLEERLADVLDRAAREAGIDLP